MDWGGIDAILQEERPAADQAQKENEPPLECPSAVAETESLDVSEPEANGNMRDEVKTKAASLANKYRCRARRQAKTIEKMKRKQSALSTEDALGHLATVLPANIFSFVRFQVKASAAAPHGRRYSDEELMYWLSVYYQGPRAYRQLRRRFVMPSPRVLRNRMQHIQTLPGFQDAMLAVLKEHLRGTEERDRMVVLSFDEVHLRRKLTYVPWMDCVEGTEHFGPVGKTPRLADSALTFMARGLTKRWKQPVGYFFSAGPATADMMEQLLVQLIRKLREAGLIVVASVCDMAKPNQKLYKALGVTVDSPQFDVDGCPVIALFDVPHIFKCLRNCLFQHNIHVDGQTMSWDHVKQFFQLDVNRVVRTAPKLTNDHIMVGPFRKMKVKLATQVLSRSVASGMGIYADPEVGKCQLLGPGILCQD